MVVLPAATLVPPPVVSEQARGAASAVAQARVSDFEGIVDREQRSPQPHATASTLERRAWIPFAGSLR